jgi:predicted  nucleic acid-binding Zn-ribbon protein
VSGPFVCQRCGDSYPTDPRLIVPCPDCHAKAGSSCVRPSEHRASQPHKRRRELAFEQMPCSCLRLWEERQAALAGGQTTLTL